MAKRKLYLIFNVWGKDNNNVSFLHATNQWTNRLKGVRLSSLKFAQQIARTAGKAKGDLVGVAPEELTDREIIAQVKRKRK